MKPQLCDSNLTQACGQLHCNVIDYNNYYFVSLLLLLHSEFSLLLLYLKQLPLLLQFYSFFAQFKMKIVSLKSEN